MADQQISMFSDQSAPVSGKPATFSISKTVNASAQRAFDQWLIPVFLEEWLFGAHTGGEQVINLQNTVRKGGEFTYQVNRQGEDVSYVGDYAELDIPNRLAFTWGEKDAAVEPLQISVQFTADGDKTRIKLQGRIPADRAADRDAIKALWASRCNALAGRFKS
jgi:uncharacterized protein YndB with AHSA1/START domain